MSFQVFIRPAFDAMHLRSLSSNDMYENSSGGRRRTWANYRRWFCDSILNAVGIRVRWMQSCEILSTLEVRRIYLRQGQSKMDIFLPSSIRIGWVSHNRMYHTYKEVSSHVRRQLRLQPSELKLHLSPGR